VVEASPTGTEVNDVPEHRLTLRVTGPQGPYTATVKRVLPEHLIAMMLGQEVAVRVHPQSLSEVILEE
jgi:hypothetical protein